MAAKLLKTNLGFKIYFRGGGITDIMSFLWMKNDPRKVNFTVAPTNLSVSGARFTSIKL